MRGLPEPGVHALGSPSLRFKSRCSGWAASWQSQIIPVGRRGHTRRSGTASPPHGYLRESGKRESRDRCTSRSASHGGELPSLRGGPGWDETASRASQTQLGRAQTAVVSSPGGAKRAISPFTPQRQSGHPPHWAPGDYEALLNPPMFPFTPESPLPPPPSSNSYQGVVLGPVAQLGLGQGPGLAWPGG